MNPFLHLSGSTLAGAARTSLSACACCGAVTSHRNECGRCPTCQEIYESEAPCSADDFQEPDPDLEPDLLG